MDAESANYERVTWKRSGLREGTGTGSKWRGALDPNKRRGGLWWWLAPLIAIPAIAIMALWGISHIQGDVEEAAAEILLENGVSEAAVEAIDFDASFRDVDLEGPLPEGFSARQIEELIEQNEGEEEGEDIRDADASGLVAAAVQTGPLNAQLNSDGESIVLTGTVPAQDNADDLVAAAEASGLPVDNQLVVSGLAASSSDADGQIQRLGAIAGGLGAGAIISANLEIGDEGPVEGTIRAADDASRDLLAGTSGDGVDVTAPAALGALDTSVDFDGERIVLNGTVLTDDQSASLETAAADVVGAGNVTNNLEVSGLDEAVEGADGRVAALGAAIGTFGGLESADGTMNDTDLTVNGVAPDEATRQATLDAVAAAEGAGLRPGGEVTAPEEIPLAEQIDLLQAELDALQDEIRQNVVFDSNSDVLTPVAQGTLDKVIAAMQRYPRPVVEVGGHTDSQGNDAFNQDLSQRRSNSVVAYVGEATSTDRLNPVGYGETQPIGDNLTEEGRLQNRRVEFIAKESF